MINKKKKKNIIIYYINNIFFYNNNNHDDKIRYLTNNNACTIDQVLQTAEEGKFEYKDSWSNSVILRDESGRR